MYYVVLNGFNSCLEFISEKMAAIWTFLFDHQNKFHAEIIKNSVIA